MTDVAGVERRDEAPATAPEEAKRKRLILAVCCIAQFLVILDLSIVNVALPTIQAALRISAVDLQWVIDAYAIIFAGFLMLAGRATDLFGQRRTFALALTGFAIASLIGGLAPNSTVLILARGAQGLAGAGMAAASLAIITSTFAARARAPPCDRAVGRDERRGRRGRHAAGRRPDRRPELALGAADQRADRDRRRHPRAPHGARAPGTDARRL